jgi:hypothetical protein
MIIKEARELLGITDTIFTLKELKQQYRINALRYHPDKNREIDTSAKFQEIKAAYDYLLPYVISDSELDMDMDMDQDQEQENNTTGPTGSSSSYSVILKYFMGSLQTTYSERMNDVMKEMVEKMLSVCEKQAIQILEKIEGLKFQTVYTVLTKYRHVFLLSPEFYVEMEKMREKKRRMGSIDIIELHPKIEDVFAHMVYKLTRNEETYYVPLWHQEMIFEEPCSSVEEENTRKEFMVRCTPDFSSLVKKTWDLPILELRETWIDDENHVHIQMVFSILALWECAQQKKEVVISFSENKSVCFLPENIFILAEGEQVLRWRKEGISRISNNMCDISRKSDLVLHVLLV